MWVLVPHWVSQASFSFSLPLCALCGILSLSPSLSLPSLTCSLSLSIKKKKWSFATIIEKPESFNVEKGNFKNKDNKNQTMVLSFTGYLSLQKSVGLRPCSHHCTKGEKEKHVKELLKASSYHTRSSWYSGIERIERGLLSTMWFSVTEYLLFTLESSPVHQVLWVTVWKTL